MESIELSTIFDPQMFAIIGVSLLWGITNPFIARGTKSATRPPPDTAIWLRPLLELHCFVSNWRFALPFVLNQLASLLFMALVVNLPLTFTVVSVNSLTFLITAITGVYIGEGKLSAHTIVGCILVLVGVIITTIF
uniref:Transmembrane protein 234 homolog n=1 Tax=Panagrellus redivivus TaxID=6233 RepID=A0A7E4VTL3_PANRE